MSWQRFLCSSLLTAIVAGFVTPWVTALAAGRASDGYVIEVRKSARQMWLKNGKDVLRQFNIVLGPAPTGGKLLRGDGRTPVGRYYISGKKPNSQFHRFLAISYPSIQDAERALDQKIISEPEWTDIFFANLQEVTPPQNTLMGGWVGIHGYGGREELPVDWTAGCIAVTNRDIDYLYDIVPLGTPVEISD